MTRQFVVFANPQTGREAHPYLICLQSDMAQTSGSMVVAPLTPAHTLANASTRLFPELFFMNERYRVLIPQLAAVPTRVLRDPVGDLNGYRNELLAAIDLLFTGI
ncbi:MAG: CcdB family protein [Halothiobacillaceae bacterium]|jgi:toxin CcdB|nr:CcdB family protein [Halothiobacillaceae bacterium]